MLGQRTVLLEKIPTRLLRKAVRRRRISYEKVVNELVMAAMQDLAHAKAACGDDGKGRCVWKCDRCTMGAVSHISRVIDE